MGTMFHTPGRGPTDQLSHDIKRRQAVKACHLGMETPKHLEAVQAQSLVSLCYSLHRDACSQQCRFVFTSLGLGFRLEAW
jgi:hypothetical protein